MPLWDWLLHLRVAGLAPIWLLAGNGPPSSDVSAMAEVVYLLPEPGHFGNKSGGCQAVPHSQMAWVASVPCISAFGGF